MSSGSSEASLISDQADVSSNSSLSAKTPVKKITNMERTVATRKSVKHNGFHHTDTYGQDNEFFLALRNAKYRWISIFTLEEGEVHACQEEGRHILLLQKGKLKAENVSHAWINEKVQTLDDTEHGQKILGPVRRNGEYKLTAESESNWYEGHICLSPSSALEMVGDGNLAFYVKGDPVDPKTVIKHLENTKFSASTKKVNVRTTGASIDPTAKAIQKWFRDEWDSKAYNSRHAATRDNKINITGLHEHEDSEHDEDSGENEGADSGEKKGKDGDKDQGKKNGKNDEVFTARLIMTRYANFFRPTLRRRKSKARMTMEALWASKQAQTETVFGRGGSLGIQLYG